MRFAAACHGTPGASRRCGVCALFFFVLIPGGTEIAGPGCLEKDGKERLEARWRRGEERHALEKGRGRECLCCRESAAHEARRSADGPAAAKGFAAKGDALPNGETLRMGPGAAKANGQTLNGQTLRMGPGAGGSTAKAVRGRGRESPWVKIVQ